MQTSYEPQRTQRAQRKIRKSAFRASVLSVSSVVKISCSTSCEQKELCNKATENNKYLTEFLNDALSLAVDSGKAAGKAEKAVEVARYLFSVEIDFQIVQSASGLSWEVLQELRMQQKVRVR